MRRQHAVQVADATCLRILREAGLTLPIDYVRERRDLAAGRREAVVELASRRNRVWQMDFFELETSGGGTWRSGDVIDDAIKLVLAGPVTATQTHREAIASVRVAVDEAERLLGRPLLDDLAVDPDTGENVPISLVTDNGPCFKAAAFEGFVAASRAQAHPHPTPQPADQRRHRALPRAIKIEQLWRALPADGTEMTAMVDHFRELYNHVRPHEALDGDRPIERYLADPASNDITPQCKRARPRGFLDAGHDQLKAVPGRECRALLGPPPETTRCRQWRPSPRSRCATRSIHTTLNNGEAPAPALALT